MKQPISTHRNHTTALWISIKESLKQIYLIFAVAPNDDFILDPTAIEIAGNMGSDLSAFALARNRIDN
jgi:hypothetical protein